MNIEVENTKGDVFLRVQIEASTQLAQDLIYEAKELGHNVEKLSDGYHTFEELYEFRKAYNAVLFNALHNLKYTVGKSKVHSDGTMFEGYFMVFWDSAEGQITNHYLLKDWDLFQIPEKTPPSFDGHTAQDVLQRLLSIAKS